MLQITKKKGKVDLFFLRNKNSLKIKMLKNKNSQWLKQNYLVLIKKECDAFCKCWDAFQGEREVEEEERRRGIKIDHILGNKHHSFVYAFLLDATSSGRNIYVC